VIGQARRNLEDEVIVLHARSGEPAAIVCAVPFLRDRDVRESEAGEDWDDKESALLRGIAAHYQEVVSVAMRQCPGGAQPLTLLATGHLYAAGGSLKEGDGVRDLYIGSLGRVPLDCFPPELDYVALGHLHVAQRVGPTDRVRYSGSPIPLGFGEAGQQKSVCVLELQGKSVELSRINVPVFQKLRTVGGSWDSIRGELLALVREGESVWAEVVLEGDDGPPDLAKCVHELVADSSVEVLRIKHERQNADPWDIPDDFVNLDDIRPEDVFSRFLDANNCEGERRERLTRTFLEMLSSMAGQDPEATN